MTTLLRSPSGRCRSTSTLQSPPHFEALPLTSPGPVLRPWQKEIQMKKPFVRRAFIKSALMLVAVLALVLPSAKSQAQDWYHSDSLKAELNSFNQVPSVLTKSHGKFDAQINEDGTISFTLSYSGMSSPVVQAHIHFGAGMTNGGVAVFLCGGAKPACPASGTINGTITAADVSVLPVTNGDSVIPQGIQPGDLAGLFRAIRMGDTYVNVHTTTFPAGEIRGQVTVDRDSHFE